MFIILLLLQPLLYYVPSTPTIATTTDDILVIYFIYQSHTIYMYPSVSTCILQHIECLKIMNDVVYRSMYSLIHAYDSIVYAYN